MKFTLPLYLIAVAVIVIALQNAGIVKPLNVQRVRIVGYVDIGNTVDVNVENSLPIKVDVDNAPLEVTVVR